MNYYLITYRFHHHYSVSGYNRLAEFLPCVTVSVPRSVGFVMDKLASPRRRALIQQETGLSGYFPECRWLEWKITRMARRADPGIFHFIYPENSYYYASLRPRPVRSKMIATYHQPVRESRQFILKTEPLRRLDMVILLSESQREFFEPLVGNDRIAVIPHGIDTQFFNPPCDPPDEQKIIAVGNWLRDFPTLVSALKILQSRTPRLSCDVVTLPENQPLFAGLTNVRFHADISDARLLELYRRASVSVLSLTNGAANNALLESMACGLPVIATDLPAVREYTDPRGALYTEHGNSEHLAETIVALMDDQQRMRTMSQTNLAHVRRYAWENVAKQMMAVYRNLSEASR